MEHLFYFGFYSMLRDTKNQPASKYSLGGFEIKPVKEMQMARTGSPYMTS